MQAVSNLIIGINTGHGTYGQARTLDTTMDDLRTGRHLGRKDLVERLIQRIEAGERGMISERAERTNEWVQLYISEPSS